MVETSRIDKLSERESIPFVEGSFSAQVKNMPALINKQKRIKLSFKWHVYADSSYADDSLKIGLEFRDIYGKLIFAVLNRGGSHVCYASTGLDSDSTLVNLKFEPNWAKDVCLKITNYTCEVHLLMNFEDKKQGLSCEIMDTKGNQLLKVNGLPLLGIGLGKIVGINYGSKQFPISHNLYDVCFKDLNDQVKFPLAGKSIYAFGDSIVNGHLYAEKGFVDFLAQQEGMKIKKYAVNGGTILPGESNILQQVVEATTATPDFMLFNGGTNDAFERNEQYFGVVTPGDLTGPFDKSTYAGSMEEIIQTAKKKWPNTKIVFVAVPRLCSRHLEVQEKLHAIQQTVCEKWQIGFLDMYANSRLDTTDDRMRKKYTFDSLGTDGFPGTPETIISVDDKTPSGTHPNFAAIQSFFVPELIECLQAL